MKKIVLNVMVVLTVMFSTVVIVTGEAPVPGDESLFVANVPPDALILLDMSGSMMWDPAGNSAVYPNRRIDIARKVLKDLLDDNDDTFINTTDEDALNLRLGYMRFWNTYGEDSVVDPYAGNILVKSDVGSHYSDVWLKIVEAGTDETTAYDPVGGTPLAGSAREAKKYFVDNVNPKDTAIECRKKFVILVTDGEDTWGCNGNGWECTPKMRMLTVQRVKELKAAGVYVFVVGFGSSLPISQQRTLNWAALYGGTFNPEAEFVGDPEAYNIDLYLPTDPALSACDSTADPVALDPANYELSGYAFLAADAAALSASMKSIIAYIAKKAYSYTSPTAPAIRISEAKTVYLSSFIPNETPYWEGTFRGYTLNDDGTVPVDGNGYPINPVWDAGQQLKLTNPDNRTIYVNLDNSSTPKLFTTANVSRSAVGLGSDTDKNKLVNHIRGFDAYDIDLDKNTTEQKLFKLADIVHSNGVIVGEPSRYFEDQGYNGTGGFYETNKSRKKVIISGANDGMLHAFDAATGNETWGFIPKALLTSLKLMRYSHTYFVDSSPRVADVWFYSSSTDTTKTADEWRTVLICGLRKGGKSYFALDITDTEHPKFMWEFPVSSGDKDKMGESWSEPTIGKVKIEGTDGKLYERWVAFIGGGYLKGENTKGNDPTGRSFFVIDIKTGTILWEFYWKDNVSNPPKNKMTWGLAASPTAVDMDYDGFIDKVYLGDLGGNMWVFNVSANDDTKKSNSLWSGKVLFDGTKNHPIYYQPAVAFDQKGIPWLLWGTGDREDPTNKNTYDRFIAVKDDEDANVSYPYTVSNLTNVTTTNTFDPDPLDKGTANKGWYIELEKSEKVLARTAAFSGIVYFTTFTPGEAKECKVAGGPRLYMVEFRSGGGALGFSMANYLANKPSTPRYISIGSGVPSSPVISVDSKGKASVIAGTTGGGVYSQVIYSSGGNKQLLYWREVTP
jgi:type IV pilus assembly protein PilY1